MREDKLQVRQILVIKQPSRKGHMKVKRNDLWMSEE